MERIFAEVFNLSAMASLLVVAVMVLRCLLKKVPKSFVCVLWAMVAIRLIFPFSVESPISAVPDSEAIFSDIAVESPAFENGDVSDIPLTEDIVDNAEQNLSENKSVPSFISVVSVVWLIGIECMLIYLLLSYLRVKYRVREAVKYSGNIWICDSVETPFIFGVITPRIYLPSSMSKSDEAYVIAHEKAHLKRLDHLWKPIGFMLLTVYWFNPLIWAAYVLLCRDIEFACDERVIKELGSGVKKDYSEALVNCSATRRTIAVCPLAFGEVGVRKRIVSVLNYKKPTFWIIVLAVVAIFATAVLFLTNQPKNNENGKVPNSEETEAETEHIHNWTDWVLVKEGICTEAARWTRECGICRETEETNTGSVGHSLIDLPPKNATCTEAGYINYRKCIKCDYETFYEIEPLGHDYKNRECTRCYKTTAYSEGLALEEIFGYKAKVYSRGNCKENEIYVPPTYNGYPVTEIEWLFHEDKTVKKVVLPESIEKIGLYTFSEAYSLESVTMGNNVKIISSNAFAECTSLKEIKLSNALTHIGGYAFKDCTGLESIVIPKSVKVINGNAFDGCSNLKKVIIEDPASWNAEIDLSDSENAAEWLKSPKEKKK